MTRHSNTSIIARQAPDIRHLIRAVRHDDCAALERLCWPHRSVETNKSHIIRLLQLAQQGRGSGVVIEHNKTGQIIAYGQWQTLTHCIEISNLRVATSHQSQGIGTALIQYIIQTMHNPHGLRIEIGVDAQNVRALKLYQKLGFRIHKNLILNTSEGREVLIYLVLSE